VRISHWALAGKGDTYWWRGVFRLPRASQAKILGPVGNGLRNEHVENEHAGGLTALIQDTVIRILTPVSDIKGLPHLLPLDV
jgi:hypothetical protein